MGAGSGLTVTCLTVKQPVEEKVYVILAVPAASPVTTPPASTLAVDGLLLAQVPPVEVVDNVAVEPTHTVAVPVMEAGFGLMETVTLPSGPQQPPADWALK